MADKNKELNDAFRELINEGELTTYESDQSLIYERQAIENYETNVAERLVALVRKSEQVAELANEANVKSEEVAELAKDLDQIFNARVERIQSWRELQKDAQKD